MSQYHFACVNVDELTLTPDDIPLVDAEMAVGFLEAHINFHPRTLSISTVCTTNPSFMG